MAEKLRSGERSRERVIPEASAHVTPHLKDLVSGSLLLEKTSNIEKERDRSVTIVSLVHVSSQNSRANIEALLAEHL